MNVSDTEVAWSVLKNAGYQKTEHVKEVSLPHWGKGWRGGGGRDLSELESSISRDEKNALVHYFCLDTVASLMAPV